MSDKHDTNHFNAKAGNEAADGAENGTGDPPAPSGYPALEFDASEFMHFLDDADWSEDEKAEYLTLVWNIVCEFVALGFNMHPLQQAKKACGKHAKPKAQSPSGGPSMVECMDDDLIEEFIARDGACSDPGGKESKND
ncbi:hypothetical protein KAJ83_04505 [Marivibrio halodurans]|uniref:Uncharacterized protein n=1 Tax=Marivibrio halodurans TaxID=2039722 RepID=A0A8J7S059_9PROT|nr:hypothetical protein [Marivibrio halodurans]MBP5856259.1 hypothetical protein [Marivibrio halodurans]